MPQRIHVLFAFYLLFLSSITSFHLRPLTTNIKFNISQSNPHTNKNGVKYYKLPLLNKIGIRKDLFYMDMVFAVVNFMRGVRAQLTEYDTKGCTYLDIDAPINANTHFLTWDERQLYFRLRQTYSEPSFFGPLYYLTLNLTLFIRDTPQCLSPTARYNIRWNLEKGYSVFGWRSGYYYTTTDESSTYDDVFTNATLFETNPKYTLRFAALPNEWEWDDIFSEEEYHSYYQSSPHGWLCARGNG
eukprot:PhF_6_TR31882/c0_g1_i4/m.47385